MPDPDLEYYTRRNRQEEEQAKKSIEPAARKSHEKLAELHRKKAGLAVKEVVAACVSKREASFDLPARRPTVFDWPAC